MRYTLTLIVIVGLYSPLFAYELPTASCEQKLKDQTSTCRTQGNKKLSDLSQCQVRVNRDYVHCAKRGV